MRARIYEKKCFRPDLGRKRHNRMLLTPHEIIVYCYESKRGTKELWIEANHFTIYNQS